MDCDICRRAFGARRPAFCASCAQAKLYISRLEQAAALLDREKSHTHVEATLRPGNDGVIAALPEDADWDAITTSIKTTRWEKDAMEQQIILPSLECINARAEELRKQMRETKEYLLKRREQNDRRSKEIAKQRIQLQDRRSRLVEPVRATSRKASRALEKTRSRTAEAREHLCRAVAFLCGLERIKNEAGRSEYRFGRLLVPDLRDLNAINGRIKGESILTASGIKPLIEPHELISATLDNVARFVSLCCCYLAVRLPAELLLPRKDFAHAMILQERSSYRFPDLDISSLETNPGASSTVLRLRKALPSPRPLQLDRSLSKLQQDDSKSFAYFVEGAMWLAWDVAWLCRSQGIDTIDTFEDVCAIGKNLNLLFSPIGWKPRPRLAGNRRLTTTTNNETPTAPGLTDTPPIRIGILSHSSASNSLAGAAGARLRESWRLESGSYNRLFDRLRNFLIDEARKAEWTFIDEKEWDEELEHEKPVFVGGTRRTLRESSMASISGRTSDAPDRQPAKNSGGDKGNSGWMKVRGRVSET